MVTRAMEPPAIPVIALRLPVNRTAPPTTAAMATNTAVTRQNEKQYALDQTAYRAAVAARREKMQMDEVTFQRQSSAYADAMAAWRVQVRACEEGKKAVCEMPAPRPQDFY